MIQSHSPSQHQEYQSPRSRRLIVAANPAQSDGLPPPIAHDLVDGWPPLGLHVPESRYRAKEQRAVLIAFHAQFCVRHVQDECDAAELFSGEHSVEPDPLAACTGVIKSAVSIIGVGEGAGHGDVCDRDCVYCGWYMWDYLGVAAEESESLEVELFEAITALELQFPPIHPL